MFAGCLQIMSAHSHLIRVEGVGYSQIIRAENADVCRSCDLCLQAATGNGAVVYTGKKPTDWEPFSPNSFGNASWNFACNSK